MADPKLTEVIRSVVESGRFGENCTFVDLVPSKTEGEDHFASFVVFADVKLLNGKNVQVVIKRQQNNALAREMMNTDIQFYNEALMYNEILPFTNQIEIIEDLFPKCFYGFANLSESHETHILVIQDLRQYGYKLTTEKLFLDFDHCALALKKLGKFHALSYSMKQENIDEFLSKVGKIKESRWESEHKDDSNKFLQVTMERGMSALLEEGEHKDLLEEIMSHSLEDPHALMKGLCRPEEPFAVLCHGDFCRNNMLFRYDATGKPEDVRFFDVATARYASPAIDLSFFLFLNTSAELRRAHWDDLLRVYHDSLSSTIPGCRVPPLEIIRLELTHRAFYGYVLCSFFIPMMLDPDSKMELEDFAAKTQEEMDRDLRVKGGQQATDYLKDILRDLINMKCL